MVERFVSDATVGFLSSTYLHRWIPQPQFDTSVSSFILVAPSPVPLWQRLDALKLLQCLDMLFSVSVSLVYPFFVVGVVAIQVEMARIY